MDIDDDLKALLGGEDDDASTPKPENDRIARGMKRTRVSLGQQQTMGFLLIKIWVAAAKTLAPFFAVLAKKQAQTKQDRIKPKKKPIPGGEK